MSQDQSAGPVPAAAHLDTLRDIRSIMDRSSRFISLSGWSGVWAGATALGGAAVAREWLGDASNMRSPETQQYPLPGGYFMDGVTVRFLILAAVVFGVALAGAFFFTWRRTRGDGGSVWSAASRRLFMAVALPIAVGGIFGAVLLLNGDVIYIAPACLLFYGLALVAGSRYTLSDVRWLGYSEIALGCISLFFPGYGLWFWAIGFGVLHLLYGFFMWNRYERGSRRIVGQ